MRESFNNSGASSFIEIDSSNLVVSALKQSEDDSDVYILRIHEERGEQTQAHIKINSLTPVKAVKVVNSLEEEIMSSEVVGFD